MPDQPLRIAISAGGTGGGLYPALAVAAALRQDHPGVELIYVGARGDMALELVARADVQFDRTRTVSAGPLHGVSRGQQALSLIKLLGGVLQALWILLRDRPRAVFVTGGWVGVPMALAAWLIRRPVVVYVPDIEPGLTLRLLGRYFARVVAATVAQTQDYFPGKQVIETGYPLRPGLADADRVEALAAFGLDPARRTLLVFGGSRGARSLNGALLAIAPALLDSGVQILHLTGETDWAQVEAQHAALSEAQRAHYRIFPYRSDMGRALAAADLVVSRGGAATLAEYPAFGLPAILAPYPYAWRYQKVNADWLVARGAAVRLDDERLAADLLPAIHAILDDPDRLTTMRAASAALRRTDGAERLARLLVETARG